MPPSPRRKKPYHHGNLKQALIDAAVELISERGHPDFTLRELAKALDVTHAATYHHFKNKDDLLAAVAEQGYREMGDHLKRVGELWADDPVMKMRHMGAAYVRFAYENRAYFRVMFGQKFANIHSYPSMRKAGAATKQMMEHTIEVGRSRGLYSDARASELMAASWSTVHGLALLTINGYFEELLDGIELEDYVMRVTRHLFLGVGSPEAQQAGRAAMAEEIMQSHKK